MTRLSKKEAFAALGAVARNAVWSWSALKRDGSGVVVTAWRDHFDWKASPPLYDGRPADDPDTADRLGARERSSLLKKAMDEHGGLVDVVLLSARDVAAVPRSIEDCFVANFRFSVISLDEGTGGFVAEVVSRSR